MMTKASTGDFLQGTTTSPAMLTLVATTVQAYSTEQTGVSGRGVIILYFKDQEYWTKILGDGHVESHITSVTSQLRGPEQSDNPDPLP
jgi:hypothetical protein